MSYTENADDIYSARRSINYYQNEIDTTNSERDAIQAKIDRLIPVRDSIVIYKRSIRSERNLISTYKTEYDSLSDWTGSNHDSFMSEYCDVLIADYRDYYKQVDDIHDALNNEITRLQNSIYEMDGTLGWLRACLNDCWTWLNNLLN